MDSPVIARGRELSVAGISPGFRMIIYLRYNRPSPPSVFRSPFYTYYIERARHLCKADYTATKKSMKGRD